MPLPGPRLDLRLRLSDLRRRSSRRASRRGSTCRRNIRLVRRLGLGHEIGDLGLQLRFDPARILIGKRAVPAGVGVDFVPSSPIVPIFNTPISRRAEEPRRTASRYPSRTAAETSQSCRDRMIVRRNEPKHHLVGRPLELPAGEHPRRVAVNQQAQQHPGMIRSRTRTAVSPAHPAKVETVDHFDDEPSQMSLRQPLVHRRRKQITRLPINRPEIVHAPQNRNKRESTCQFYSAKRRQSPTNCR